MARRYSFEEDDDSYLPHSTAPQMQYHPAATRGGASGYSVSSGAAYIPPREPSVSPEPSMHSRPQPEYFSHNSRSDHDRQHSGNLMDSSPSRLPAPPAPPAHRDPHDISLPIPPPHSHNAQFGSQPRPAAAVGLAGGTGIGAGVAAAAVDTGYHGASTTSFHSHTPSDPFRDAAESSHLNATSHSRYPSYPTSAQDPFASRHNSYQDMSSQLTPAESYEMRPPSTQKAMNFDTYGHGWHESERDLGDINIHDIADEDDDAPSSGKGRKGVAAGAAGIIGAIGSRNVSGKYGAVPGGDVEKSNWLTKQTAGNKRWKWIVGSLIGAVVLLAIIGGVIGGVIYSKRGSASAGSDDKDDGTDLDINSASIKALMNNKNLHKIFPGMDYTPFNAALYPECEKWKPSQNNVTKDVAILSQLTSSIRLYGTDCNQTEMVLHAIDKLNLKSSMKVWMGVYVWNNQTTNERQLGKMWNLLDQHGADPFAGVIVGNEVLLNQLPGFGDTELAKLLNDVRSNMTAHGWKLSVSTSDAGVSFGKNPQSTKATDIVMANVHPFFAGVAIDQASSWTWTYTQTNDAGFGKEALIAEVGWPSGGGNLCTDSTGKNTTCASKTDGAVASTDNVNKFLNTWPCQALANGTRYFMFEAFDEQWKERFNYPGAEWETQWGLLDLARNLKSGIKIPDCGGKTA